MTIHTNPAGPFARERQAQLRDDMRTFVAAINRARPCSECGYPAIDAADLSEHYNANHR